MYYKYANTITQGLDVLRRNPKLEVRPTVPKKLRYDRQLSNC